MPLGIMIVAGIVIVCFVIGVSLLFQGYAAMPSADKIAPADEMQKVRADLTAANSETEKLRGQSNTLAVQLEEMKGKLSWAEENVKALEKMVNSGSQAQSRLDQLEKDLSFLSQKADSQAREAIEVITRLAAETETLQQALSQGAPAANTDEFNSLKDENLKLKIQVDGYVSKVKELEAIAQSAQAAGNQADDINKAKAVLAEENAILKNNLADLEIKIKAAQAETEKFKAELTQNIAELQNKIVVLENENTSLKQQPAPANTASDEKIKMIRLENEERIVQANAAFVKLSSDMDLLNLQISEKDTRIKKLTEDLLYSRQEAAVALQELVELKAAHKTMSIQEPLINDQEVEFLKKRLEELATANQRLRDKEKILAYKLAQSRAQAMGLEKVFEDLKVQVEGR